MNSSYDLVYEDDLPGFLCIKTQFWDRGMPDVEVLIRRPTIDGDLVWLSSKAVSYVSQPVPGIILEETLVQDEDLAKQVNRITRIAAVLVQAVEAAWLTHSQSEPGEAELKEDRAQENQNKEGLNHASPSLLSEDLHAYQQLMQQVSGSGEHETGVVLQNLIQLAAQSSAKGGAAVASKLAQEIIERFARGKNKSFDPFSMMESVRKGVRLDFCLTRLCVDEVKLITAVLVGLVPVEQVVPAVLRAIYSGEGLSMLAAQIRLDSDKLPRYGSSSAFLQPPPAANGYGNGALSPERSRIEPPSPSEGPPGPPPPPISVVNLSYTYIGNTGVEMLSEILYSDTKALKTLDVSFCGIEEKGFLALARAFARRKRKQLPALRGVILSGNNISSRAAGDLGIALSPLEQNESRIRRRRSRTRISVSRTGYDSDSNESDDEDDDDFSRPSPSGKVEKCCSKSKGLQLLHVANASLTAKSLTHLLEGLGIHCSVRELNLSSNGFGPAGASALVKFLETQSRAIKHKVMPFLDRVDLSNNELGDDGTTQLTRAIASKKSQLHVVDLKLSSNTIGPGGIETLMSKLLQKHELLSLSLDKNNIGDQGCQLVAASLHTMRSLARLNLSFNQIGSRGINSLMRSLVACESVTFLGLSGNILRISGAIALAFTLSQHPRLEELDLDNCCLGQAAQCHLVTGIISNRWVPMKRLKGFSVGAPMVAIGALEPYSSSLSNDECFRIRRDEQMKTILQWTEENRNAKREGVTVDPDILLAAGLTEERDYQQARFLTPEFVSELNAAHVIPSQNAYLRLLGWLSHIPVDEDELTALQKYFYDADGGEGDRGSDGYINLKLRGDLLAALDSEVADGFREELPSLAAVFKGSVGIDLDKLFRGDPSWNAFEAFKGTIAESPPVSTLEAEEEENVEDVTDGIEDTAMGNDGLSEHGEMSNSDIKMSHTESGVSSVGGKEKKQSKVKPRITMFPLFEKQLEDLKAEATEMIEQEDDPMQHDIILSQYAEASLTILRQLRYHCMNSGLDGWRKVGLKRKVLVVDDSKVTRKMVSHAFEKADFIVDTASNGAEGVEKLKASIYDIAFMDIDMPVLNGFEATKQLREWEDTMRPGARQPICALTATYVDDFEKSELMKFKEAGLDVMEPKPCNIPRLFKVVDDVSPMFSDLSISVIQRERSDSKLSDTHSLSDRSLPSV